MNLDNDISFPMGWAVPKEYEQPGQVSIRMATNSGGKVTRTSGRYPCRESTRRSWATTTHLCTVR